MRFDDTTQNKTKRTISDMVELGRIGKVTDVTPHDEPDDKRNHEVDVEWPPGQMIEKYRDVPISQASTGFLCVPEIGDLVLIQFRDLKESKPIVTDIVYGSNQEDRAPLGEPGIIRGVRDDKYFEMHPDGDWVRIAQKSDDNAEPEFKVEINDNGVHIEGGDVTVDADTIVSNGGGTIVATEGDSITGDGHDHDGEVSEATVTGTVDTKDDGDIEVDQ